MSASELDPVSGDLAVWERIVLGGARLAAVTLFGVIAISGAAVGLVGFWLYLFGCDARWIVRLATATTWVFEHPPSWPLAILLSSPLMMVIVLEPALLFLFRVRKAWGLELPGKGEETGRNPPKPPKAQAPRQTTPTVVIADSGGEDDP